jgi:peptidoglycan/LPS O-acetylase OafA/YrhL
VLFPVAATLVSRWWIATAALICAVKWTDWSYGFIQVALVKYFPHFSQADLAVWATTSLLLQAAPFAGGFLAYHLTRGPQRPALGTAIGIAGAVSFIVVPQLGFTMLPSATQAIPLTMIVYCFAAGGAGRMVNPAINALGRVSFSAYVLHFAVINLFYLVRPDWLSGGFFGFVVVLAATVIATFLISALSLKYVETPGIEMGRRIVATLKTRTARNPTTVVNSG